MGFEADSLQRIFLASIILGEAISSQIEYIRMPGFEGYRPTDPNPIVIVHYTPEDGILSCCLACLQNENCHSYFWNTRDFTCEMYATRFDNNHTMSLEQKYGEQYYVKANRCEMAGFIWVNDLLFCFQIYTNSYRSHNESNLACSKTEGGRLARIDTSDKQNHVKITILSLNGVFGGFWIDGNDLAQEGVWKYSDGSPMTTTFWNTAQPSNKFGIENCASMRSSYGYLWNDRYCEDDINYICEIV
ncbi:mannose receptor, C type [Mytilus galloprovincialis]|uniref:Mannose receptor, C type n=2 Tax=Mytilus galloprovincialis TaxID=29158 RepID=A0A8B6GLA3_MYTGA|nr:mannose receptor, C type [Mytilus galloprovincialis]